MISISAHVSMSAMMSLVFISLIQHSLKSNLFHVIQIGQPCINTNLAYRISRHTQNEFSFEFISKFKIMWLQSSRIFVKPRKIYIKCLMSFPYDKFCEEFNGHLMKCTHEQRGYIFRQKHFFIHLTQGLLYWQQQMKNLEVLHETLQIFKIFIFKHFGLICFTNVTSLRKI